MRSTPAGSGMNEIVLDYPEQKGTVNVVGTNIYDTRTVKVVLLGNMLV